MRAPAQVVLPLIAVALCVPSLTEALRRAMTWQTFGYCHRLQGATCIVWFVFAFSVGPGNSSPRSLFRLSELCFFVCENYSFVILGSHVV